MGSGAIKKREEIASEYKWVLEDIYPQEELWEADFESVKKLMIEMEGLQCSLGRSAEDLLKALQLNDELGRKCEKLYVYARMRRDENNAESYYQALFDRAEGLSIQVGSSAAFMVPEILEIPEGTVNSRMAEALSRLSCILGPQMQEKRGHVLGVSPVMLPKENAVL